MTYLDLVQDLQRESGAGGNPIQSFANQRGMAKRLIQWVQRADLLLQHRWVDWKFLWKVATPIVTANGARDYAGDTDLNVWQRDSLRVDGQPIELHEYRSALVDDGTKGVPQIAYQLPNRQLRLYPTPDGAYTITAEYYRRPVTILVETDQSVISSHFHPAILWQALWLYGNFENAPESKLQGQEMLGQYLLAMEAQELPAGLGHRSADAGLIKVVPQ